MGGLRVIVATVVLAGIDMDSDRVELWLDVEELVPHLFGDRVTRPCRQLAIDHDRELRFQSMAQPADTHVRQVLDALELASRLEPIDDLRAYSIHEPMPHVPC